MTYTYTSNLRLICIDAIILILLRLLFLHTASQSSHCNGKLCTGTAAHSPGEGLRISLPCHKSIHNIPKEISW